MADKPTPGIIPGISDAFASRTDILMRIRSPLGFFVLALLIIEIFLIFAGTLFGLPLGWRIGALVVGVLLFILVVGCVYRLVVKYPTHLVFSETSHVASLAMRLHGDDAHPLSRFVRGVPPPEPPTGQLPPSTTEGS